MSRYPCRSSCGAHGSSQADSDAQDWCISHLGPRVKSSYATVATYALERPLQGQMLPGWTVHVSSNSAWHRTGWGTRVNVISRGPRRSVSSVLR
jgi:hypothetical protein